MIKHIKMSLENRPRVPWEDGASESAEIVGKIAECREGNRAAFVFFKDLPKQILYAEYGVKPEEYYSWLDEFEKDIE